MSTFASRLAAAMAYVGYNGQELAHRAGMSQPYISQLLSGERERPSTDTADRLAQALGNGISGAYLLGLLSPRDAIRIDERVFRYLSRPPAPVKGGTRQSGRKRGAKKRGTKTEPTTLFGGKRADV